MINTFQKNFQNKRIFNPSDKKDMECFKKFIKQGRWDANGCPFMLENPYISIPHMIQDKIVKNIFRI
jgi:hypothetical protein